MLRLLLLLHRTTNQIQAAVALPKERQGLPLLLLLLLPPLVLLIHFQLPEIQERKSLL